MDAPSGPAEVPHGSFNSTRVAIGLLAALVVGTGTVAAG